MDFKFLPDIPIESNMEDSLAFKDFIELLQSSIYHTQTPFVYGVLGNWGSGKTSILKLLQNMLENDLDNGYSNAIPIWFNAWEYENETNLLYPLLECIKLDYVERLKTKSLSKDFGKYFLDAISASTFTLGDIGLRAVTKALVGEAIKLEDIEKHLQSIKEHSSEIEKSLSKWTDEIRALRNSFKKLLEVYAKEFPFKKERTANDDVRFVILIDDLDRCLPETVVEILEKIKNFLSVDKCIFVLALNPRVVYQGIRVKYHGLDVNGREYLEKILNYSFYVPEPDSEHIELYCRRSLEKLVGEADREGFSGYFDRFGQILCDSHFSNPRKIKRILNHFLFFLKLNELTIKNYHLPNIIRLIILAEYYPSVFELFLNDGSSTDKILAELKKLGSESFNVQDFGKKFGVDLGDSVAELVQMKGLFDLISQEGRDQKNISDHARSVFRIVRLS